MAASDYTDIVARFSDQLAAETLANFLASSGIACDVQTLPPESISGETYSVRVARGLIAEMKEVCNLTRVARFNDPVSPQIVAGRLARENIPCFVGLMPAIHGAWGWGGTGYSAVPVDDTGELAGNAVIVPASFVEEAQRILKEPPLSDAELSEAALRTVLDSEDPP
jgi:ABC-type transport system substrate-binding protein